MPIHDWSDADVLYYHNLHRGWTVELKRALNRGLLPDGHYAMLERSGIPEADPQESEAANYARRTDRVLIRRRDDHVAATIEIVSPGTKENRSSINAFVGKMVDYLRNGVNVVVIDPFPPGPRDPEGLHQRIWDGFVGLRAEPRPPGLPLTIVSYDAGGPVAYIDSVAVGDPLPDAPLFLAPGWYVKIPLERTYEASWNETPQETRDLLVPPSA